MQIGDKVTITGTVTAINPGNDPDERVLTVEVAEDHHQLVINAALVKPVKAKKQDND